MMNKDRKRSKKAAKANWKASIFVIVVAVLLVLMTSDIITPFLGDSKSTPQPERKNAIDEYVLTFPDQGGQHIPEGTEFDGYNSNPPTSGPHWPEEAEWGIYDKELPDEQIVHNLEHCGIWISYRPDIPQETKDAIKSFAASFPTKMIVTPRHKNDAPVALVAWQHLVLLNGFSKDIAEAFVARYLNKAGPECNED